MATPTPTWRTIPDGRSTTSCCRARLQAVERPREVLRQMLRIGTRALVSFPNFGHWRVRWQLVGSGRMPMTPTWDRPWYETPNIHPCTIQDFFDLCAHEGYAVERWLAVDDGGRRAPWRRYPALANLFGEQALFSAVPRHPLSVDAAQAGYPELSRLGPCSARALPEPIGSGVVLYVVVSTSITPDRVIPPGREML